MVMSLLNMSVSNDERCRLHVLTTWICFSWSGWRCEWNIVHWSTSPRLRAAEVLSDYFMTLRHPGSTRVFWTHHLYIIYYKSISTNCSERLSLQTTRLALGRQGQTQVLWFVSSKFTLTLTGNSLWWYHSSLGNSRSLCSCNVLHTAFQYDDKDSCCSCSLLHKHSFE